MLTNRPVKNPIQLTRDDVYRLTAAGKRRRTALGNCDKKLSTKHQRSRCASLGSAIKPSIHSDHTKTTWSSKILLNYVIYWLAVYACQSLRSGCFWYRQATKSQALATDMSVRRCSPPHCWHGLLTFPRSGHFPPTTTTHPVNWQTFRYLPHTSSHRRLRIKAQNK